MPEPEIVHLGGEHTVTGSCHLLRANGLNIMVDCGISQGDGVAIPIERWPLAVSEIDYLFLTHAHIDHIGRLPELIDNGFDGEIICSYPTKALLAPMLADAMHLARYADQQSRKILKDIDELSWGFEYGSNFTLKNGIEFKLGRAGHILGSCFFHFSIAGSSAATEEAPSFKVVFSGDLGSFNTPILCDPDIPGPCDLLIMESTYGGRCHEGRAERQERLGTVIKAALADNGKILVPAFSLGRTQEFLYELDRLYGDTPPVPVFIDSPLGLKITEIYSTMSAFWDKEAKALMSTGDHPFDFSNLYSTGRFRDHQKLLGIPGPAIIIAGSGMCSGGRIIDHLLNDLSDRKTDIFFVGYQAYGTLGRDLVKYSRRAGGYVRMHGQKITIKARVHSLTGYSAHADQQGLLNWVKSMPQKPGRIKLVHGEPESQKVLAEKLRSDGYSVL